MKSSDPHLIGVAPTTDEIYPENSEMLAPFFVTTLCANGSAARSE
jgi:hypothetical protein